MNGIKEGIKSIGVMDSGSPDYQEALSNLSARLKSLQVRTALYIVALRSTRQCLLMKSSNIIMRHDLHR